jgi:DNA polymerase-3 subunit delta'
LLSCSNNGIILEVVSCFSAEIPLRKAAFMKISWTTFGHERIKAILEKQLESGKFSHAYLFRGPEGVGKRTLTEEFAKKILKTDKLSNHPDFISLGIDEKVSVEDVRKLCSKLAVKPFSAKYTVAIVDSAHLLNLSSGNALLKTLEEPSASSIIILISGGKVLPTIMSRCQTFMFNPLTVSECEAYAKMSGEDYENSALVLSGGSIGTLKSLGHDPKALESLQAWVKRLEKVHSSGLADKLLAVQEFAEMEDEQLSETLRARLHYLRNSLAALPESYGQLTAIIKALAQLRTNMNKKFILQKLFLEI